MAVTIRFRIQGLRVTREWKRQCKLPQDLQFSQCVRLGFGCLVGNAGIVAHSNLNTRSVKRAPHTLNPYPLSLKGIGKMNRSGNSKNMNLL